jgi:hypothetical protein
MAAVFYTQVERKTPLVFNTKSEDDSNLAGVSPCIHGCHRHRQVGLIPVEDQPCTRSVGQMLLVNLCPSPCLQALQVRSFRANEPSNVNSKSYPTVKFHGTNTRYEFAR